MIDEKLNEVAIMQMKKAAEYDTFENNVEKAHFHADSILCQVLQELGYKELVKIYLDIDKWYS